MPEAIDVSTLLALRQLRRPGQPDPAARIAARFLEEGHQRLAALQTAVEIDDAAEIERVAHAFKGIAGTVGAHELQDLARQLEIMGRDGRTATARELIGALEASFARAQPIFEELRDGV